jgi:hypothetical protein
METRTALTLALGFLFAGALIAAQAPAQAPAVQQRRPLSPEGTASVHVQGKWEGERYVGGSWIDITYGRPMLRGREAFTGTGANFGKNVHPDAPVWRAGANLSTRLKTPVPLVIGGTTVPAGDYGLFIEFKDPTTWTFIVSGWAQAQRFNAPISEGIFGAYGYTPEKDVVRAPMRVDALPAEVEQLTWAFVDMTNAGGRMAIMWDKTMASVPFTFGRP